MEYILEIYMPGSARDVWVHFASSKPFMPICKGDILNPGLWEGSQSPMKVVRVINIEHIIIEKEEGFGHKILVFTEEVEGTEELRLKN